MKTHTLLQSVVSLLAVIAILASGGVLQASTHTWTGPASGVWSNAANWSGGLPTTGESGGTIVQFNASSSSIMDLASIVVDEIHFTGTGNTLTIANGRTLGISGAVLSNNILDDVGGNVIAGPGGLDLQGALTIFLKVQAGNLTVSCSISGATNVTISGNGANGVIYTGNNTYTSTTTVTGGTLQLNSPGSNTAVRGPLIVGSGGGTASTVRLVQSIEIGDSVSVTVNSDGTFNTGGFSETVGGLSVLGGTVTQGASGTFAVASLSMTGGSITGSGTAVLSLSGDVTATSSAASGATISSTVSLNATRTFTVNDGPNVNDLTLSGILQNGSATSGMKKAGAGALLMLQANANTYTGATTVSAGLLTLNGGSSSVIPGALVVGEGSGAVGSAIVRLGQSTEIANAASVSVNSDGVFDLNNFSETIALLSVVDGSVTIGSGTLIPNGGVSMTGGSITTTTGTLQLQGDVTATASATGGASIAGNISLNAITRTFQVIPGPFQPELVVFGLVSDGSVVGSGLKKTGTGTMNLQGNTSNTFSGVTTVDKGTLQLGQNSGRTIVGTSLVIGNGTDPAGSATVRELIINDILSTVAVIVNASGLLDMAGFTDTIAALTGTGTVSLPSTSTLAAGTGNGTFTFGGLIIGAGTFRKAGTGVMTLTASCSASLLQVMDGTLELNVALPVTSLLRVGDGSGAANSAVLKWLNGGQAVTTTTLDVRPDGKADLNNFSQTLSQIDVVAGLVSTGSGTLTVTGSINLTGGSISVGASGGLRPGSTIVATSSPTTEASITGPITLVTSPEITVNPGSVQPELTINGDISESGGARGLTKKGTGTLKLLAMGNTFTGTTTVDQGTVTMNSSVGSIINGGLLVIGNDFDPPDSAIVRMLNTVNLLSGTPVDVKASGLLDENGHGENLGRLTGTGRVLAKSLFVGMNTTEDFTFAGALNTAPGGGAVSKAGTGIFTLTADVPSNPGGTFTIFANSGTVKVTGNQPLMGVQVAPTAALTGTGKVNGVFNGGQLAPGLPGIGTLSTNATTFGNTGTFAVDINDAIGQRNDKLNVGGILALSPTTTLALNVTGTLTRSAYVLASYGNSLTGTFGSITGLPPGYSVNYAYNDGVSSKNIAVTLPTVAFTGAVSSLGNGTAKLNGSINPRGRTTSYYFEYGPSTLYGSKTASKGGLTGTSLLPVSVPLAGLNGGTTYHFRLVAVNSSGTYYGDDATFLTPGPLVVTMAASAVSALTATLNGTVNPQALTATGYYEYGLTSAYGTKTPTLNFGNGVAAVPMPFPLSGLMPGKTYHFRLVALSSAGTTKGADVAFTTKSVLTPVFMPGGQPVSLMKMTGAVATFTVNAAEGSPSPTDAPLTYQWNKNGAPIAGAKSASYTIGSVALTHAGTYTCLVKNTGGSLLSAPAELGVVDGTARPLSVAQGTTASMTVTAAGNGLSYLWQKNLSGIGVTTKTLSIPLVQSLDSGSYTCQVTGPGGSATSGAITLSVFDGQPSILTPVTMPEGITGGLYSFQIPVDTTPARAPTSYTVTGLPAGLGYSASTGLISGRITFVAPPASKSFAITLKATNGQGSSPVVNATLLVHPFPTAGIGTYNGLVDRDSLPLGSSSINAGLGGSVSATITGIGSYTGKLILAGTTYPLTGNFNATVGSTDLSTTATFTRVDQSNLSVTFTTNTAAGTMTGTVSDALAALSVAHNSSRNPWTTAAPTNKAGNYTTELGIQNGALVGDPSYPQGRGFATVTITPAGVVTWTGKMADGAAPLTAFTTTLSATEVFPVHLMLNAGIGSAHGLVNVTPDGVVNINGGRPLMDGTLDWAKNAQPPGGPDRVYHDGFPLFNLTVRGGKYAAPAAGTPVLGLTPSNTPGTNNAHITFSQGGISGPETALVNRALRITPSNTVDLSNPTANPASLKLSINAATGAMSGSFILTNGGATRTVNYFGVLVSRTDVNAGSGYFLLPGLTPTASLSPILSGEVLLTP